MPLYDTREESGHMHIQLKALQFAEQDLADYGAIERSDLELEERTRYHVAQMQAHLPTPQTCLTDDPEALTRLIVEQYAVAYRGLLVGYTGLKEPFRLTAEPRYRTSANFDDSEHEHEFTGRAGLQALIQQEQAEGREAAKTDGCSAEAYLRTFVQVTIYDTHEENLNMPRRFICYDLVGDAITGAYAQTGVSDEILRGLGLPAEEQPCDRWLAVTSLAPGRLCDQQFHVTVVEAITASHIFTLIFPGRAVVVLHIHGPLSLDEARAFAALVLPRCSYEVRDGDETNGCVEPFHAWTCTAAQEALSLREAQEREEVRL